MKVDEAPATSITSAINDPISQHAAAAAAAGAAVSDHATPRGT